MNSKPASKPKTEAESLSRENQKLRTENVFLKGEVDKWRGKTEAQKEKVVILKKMLQRAKEMPEQVNKPSKPEPQSVRKFSTSSFDELDMDLDDFGKIVYRPAWDRQMDLGPLQEDFNEDNSKREIRDAHVSKNGNIYKGEWDVDTGKPHGLGIRVWEKDGRMYLGYFHEGNPSGYGRLTGGRGKNSGNEYIGDWKQGYFHGEGTFKWGNGAHYKGSFYKGQM